MRNSLLCFFFAAIMLLLFPARVHAQNQNSTLYASMNGTVQKTLICESQYPASVSYVETAEGHYFVYDDGMSNTALSVPINSIFSVNDLVIGVDTAYFCGSTVPATGFIGYFNIQDLFFNTQEYTVSTSLFTTSHSYVASFDKMVTFTNSSSRMVFSRILALIGRSQTGEYVTVEADCIPPTQTSHYHLGELSASYNERLLDICKLDNHVVTAGFVSSGSTGDIALRVYLKSALFTPGGPQDDAYVFQSGTPAVAGFDASQVVTSSLTVNGIGNVIAAAAYWKGADGLNNQGTVVDRFRITATNSIGFDNGFYTIQNYLDGSEKLRGMTRQNYLSSFYLLQNAVELPAGSPCGEIYEMGNTPNYMTLLDIKLRSDYLLQRIDAQSSSSGYMTNGAWLGYPGRVIWNYGLGMPSSCMTQHTTQSADMVMNSAVLSHPFYINLQQTVNFQTYTGVLESIPVERVCSE